VTRWAGLTEDELHRMLAEFGISPKLIEVDGKIAWGFERSQFEEVWKRYGIATPKEHGKRHE
jgi:hypothetical protein